MHVAFPRIIPRIMPPNHTRESYLRNIPPDQQGRAKHTPKHTPETYLRNIPRIIPPDATRFAGHGVFGKGHIYIYIYDIYMLWERTCKCSIDLYNVGNWWDDNCYLCVLSSFTFICMMCDIFDGQHHQPLFLMVSTINHFIQGTPFFMTRHPVWHVISSGETSLKRAIAPTWGRQGGRAAKCLGFVLGVSKGER